MKTTMCWNCNHSYDIEAETCPDCGSVNANVDPDAAYTEMTMRQGEMGIPSSNYQRG